MAKVIVNGSTHFEIENGTIDGNAVSAEIIKTGERFFHVLDNGKSYTVEVVRIDAATKTMILRINNNEYEVQVKEKLDLLLEKMGFDGASSAKIKDLKAPMPGAVLDIRVEAGQTIQKGDALIVLEAMKMENVLKAPGDAIVKSIEVQKGQNVEKNHVLIIFE
ncbi:MAG: acetyl-CoA carboxylase biotin carboxyl carrier protein subunit [Bacteroidetes bacterium]|nr:acetyl-CoA carboxylase biotin carboxyl carrier protein subunit [Bacteroidota bacterium]MBP7399449.1 acetyl-CoA carboxylase biotin carboxyl carrier protein subunit [Chitinophagales bacterium]MBK7107951.1 acetyl-CoA carboxylase biotin carboxyl carrier protein subunit [Bacteroidota bacterium]MBK8683397.1 acetyl-CoA carboxylase biotin carboxyl carrier protein subunit [Bacteroidota bacterium]MBP8754669.1 acetyl-CoA carboxylase biotin carboxyl carrier protein subunit [Chitinophagales bacterium]